MPPTWEQPNELKTKKFIDNCTVIVGDFNTPFTALDRSSKQKVNKEKWP